MLGLVRPASANGDLLNLAHPNHALIFFFVLANSPLIISARILKLFISVQLLHLGTNWQGIPFVGKAQDTKISFLLQVNLCFGFSVRPETSWMVVQY